jgi:septum formation protein
MSSPLVLASASPRRRELLSQLGFVFDVVHADVDESSHPGEDPVAYVRRLARAKAWAAALDRPDAVVIGADTTVDLDGWILAKPTDLDHAAEMLRALSGRTHRVHTAVAVQRAGEVMDDVVTTLVTFTPITDEVLAWYLATGEPIDKAGAYAIQGAGGVFVDRVQGSASNVVGLPLTQLARLLERAGVHLGDPGPSG